MDVAPTNTTPASPAADAQDAQEAHRKQTEWVRASLLACPKLAGDTSSPRRRGDL